MTPNTTVTLYATPFDISNKYVVKADSPGEALGIVGSYPSRVYTDCYWQRGNDFVFRANGNINEVEQYNYCVFLNNGKYNFAFITQFDYVNDAMTLVHLTIDPWLNYAGQYIFHDSPMIRAHPSNDNAPQGFYTHEPIELNQRPTVTHEARYYGIDNLPIMYLMTAVRAQDIDLDTTVTDYWDGMLDLAQQTSVQKLIDWSKNLKPHYSNVGNVQQSNTCVGDALLISGIVTAFLQNGMGNMLVGAYHVPFSLTPDQMSAIDAETIVSRSTTIELDTTLRTTAHKWRKMKVSPQFRRLILNAAGNTREVPFEYLAGLTGSESAITIQVDINPSANGYFALKLTDFGEVMDNFMCQSPSWDRVPILGYGVDQMAFKQAIYNTVTNIADTAFDVAGLLTDKASLIRKGIGGTAAAVAREGYEAVATEYQNAMNTERTVKKSGIMIGGSAGSMVVYNQSAPLIMIDLYSPSNGDCERLAKMFGTYGYMMDGEIVPISTSGLPYWKYYQTQDAAIEGRQVPQRYLNQIINRFNAGIFIFTDTSSYKDFSHAMDNHY